MRAVRRVSGSVQFPRSVSWITFTLAPQRRHADNDVRFVVLIIKYRFSATSLTKLRNRLIKIGILVMKRSGNCEIKA